MGSYLVTWQVAVEADSPRQAAHHAMSIQRGAEITATVFTVLSEAAGATETIDVGNENPLGWPRAVIKDDDVCCGHCGSSNVYYLENLTWYTRPWADDGYGYFCDCDMMAYGAGIDPRISCEDCRRHSRLPERFKGSPEDRREREAARSAGVDPDSSEADGGGG